MAPRTIGGLTRKMAHNGHILHKNYEFIGCEGSVPASAFRRILDLYSGDLDPMVDGGRTLGTALSGNILESSCIGGPYPHSSPTMARSSIQEARRPWLITNSPRE
jgi:hypothetical protein